MEKKFRVEPIMTLLFCDDCDVEMKETGHSYLSNPIQFEYACPKCNKTTTVYSCSYPNIRYRVIEEFKEN